MKEYIERDAAIELLSEPITMSMCLSTEECHHKIAQQRIDRYLIENIPAADVRPVVKAKIVDMRYTEDDGEWKCSHCGWQFTLCVCGKDVTSKIHFCPNCGADMREES